MIAGLAHYHEEYGGRNDRTALVWLVYNNPEEYLPQVSTLNLMSLTTMSHLSLEYAWLTSVITCTRC
jgi:hypothetical protein